MSKDIIVLAPNGRRQKVHCTADTLVLKVNLTSNLFRFLTSIVDIETLWNKLLDFPQYTRFILLFQILEDVCEKQGFQATEYDLKHHNHILDLTATLRFTNLPNKATLEMVEAERKREESNVTIGLLLEDGNYKKCCCNIFNSTKWAQKIYGNMIL